MRSRTDGRKRCAGPCPLAGATASFAGARSEGIERLAGAIADGVLRNPEHAGDLGMALALRHQQHQHCALIGRKVV
jgi:hypothetical protein